MALDVKGNYDWLIKKCIRTNIEVYPTTPLKNIVSYQPHWKHLQCMEHQLSVT